MAAANELVMSNEEIAAELAQDGAAAAAPAAAESESTDPALDSDEEIDNPWLSDGDAEEGDQESETDADSDETAQQKAAAQAVREFKANGKTHQVNMADQKLVDQLVTLGLGARPVFTERDQLRKQVGAKDKQIAELGKYKDLWTKLESSKHNHDALYEKIFGRKFDEVIGERSKWSQQYENASPEEKRLMDLQRRLEQSENAEVERRRLLEQQQADLAAKAEAAERKELKAMLLPEFYRHEFSSKIKDPDRAQKLNTALWKLTVSNLKANGDEWEPTPEAIRKAFRETAEMLYGEAKQGARTEVKQIVEKKKKTAKEQAQVASTRNYAGTSDTKALAKEKDPVKLFRKMFPSR